MSSRTSAPETDRIPPAESAPQVSAVRDHDWRLLVGGELVESLDGGRYETFEPATDELIAAVPAASAADVGAAVAAAQASLPAWRSAPPQERAAALREMAARLERHGEELAFLDAFDAGHPFRAMLFDVQLAVDSLRTYADWSGQLNGSVVPLSSDHLTYTVREPYGVVARIVPYNHPVMFAATKIALPLLAGNAVILKLPDQAPLSGLRMGELFRDVVPPGVLSVLSGTGAVAGDAIVAHPDIRRIGFIGSGPTGRAIQRRAAEVAVKSITLELGGKNPLIALPDANPEEVAAAAVDGMNLRMTAGQSCGSTSRLLLHESIAADVTAGVLERIAGIKLGSPLSRDTEMGCLITGAHAERVRGYVDGAVAAGAKVLTDPMPDDLGPTFVAPVVLGDVTPEMDVAREEVFGPVLSVLVWRERSEMLRIANGTPLGLTASVWADDVQSAHGLARELEAGYVWINTVSRHFTGMPFGGVKESGVGREESIDELHSYTELKSVNMPLHWAGAQGIERNVA